MHARLSNKIARLVVSLFLLGAVGLFAQKSQARIEIGGPDAWEISGEFFTFMEFRWGGGRGPNTYALAIDNAPGVRATFPSSFDKYDTISAFRFESTIELIYKGLPRLTPVLRLRPFYDAMFGFNAKSWGNIGRQWQTNLGSGLQDQYDPLVREAFVDINLHPLFIRAGRQIVTWGRSDGVLVLDVVSPRNYRNPLTFEQERFMIPQFMINASYDFSMLEWMPGGASKELQVIWNLQYLPSRFPGFNQEEEGQHPWTLNVVDFANQIILVSENLFCAPAGAASNSGCDFFRRDKWRDGNLWESSEVFVRWRGRTTMGLGPLSDITYSIHYAHLYDDIPAYVLPPAAGRIDAGFMLNIAGPRPAGLKSVGLGGMDRDKLRYDLVGVSFDKALMWLPGQLQGAVFRGELAYHIGNSFADPSFQLHKRNQVQYVLGLDQFVYLVPRHWKIGPIELGKTPWFMSLQLWQDWMSDKGEVGDHVKIDTKGTLNSACNLEPSCGDRGWVLGGQYNGFNGLRDEVRTVMTLFMFNDFLAGKTLHVELFGLHDFDSGSWIRTVVGYNFNSAFSMRVGMNYIWGSEDSFFGQFRNNNSVFVESKYTF